MMVPRKPKNGMHPCGQGVLFENLMLNTAWNSSNFGESSPSLALACLLPKTTWAVSLGWFVWPSWDFVACPSQRQKVAALVFPLEAAEAPNTERSHGCWASLHGWLAQRWCMDWCQAGPGDNDGLQPLDLPFKILFSVLPAPIYSHTRAGNSLLVHVLISDTFAPIQLNASKTAASRKCDNLNLDNWFIPAEIFRWHMCISFFTILFSCLAFHHLVLYFLQWC